MKLNVKAADLVNEAIRELAADITETDEFAKGIRKRLALAQLTSAAMLLDSSRVIS